MQFNKSFSIILPKGDTTVDITTPQSLVLIGANGSGKTRLGVWLENNMKIGKRVHRISAQKSLVMQNNLTPIPLEMARENLIYGFHNENNYSDEVVFELKNNKRWQKNPATSLLNDFNQLLVYLFSEYTDESSTYLQKSQNENKKIPTPITKLDKIKQLWEKILPHRELIIKGLTLSTKVKEGTSNWYNCSEMSDGERVIFYLIGQSLAAPENGIIIIDEPELHLHKSIQEPLWREIENLRPDCLFIYMTHDVGFATSLYPSKKIWIKKYDGTSWDWDEIPDIEGLPDELLLEILGSRKPIVFVEGDNGSNDVSLYRAILDSFLVIPCGSCSKVEQLVRALNFNHDLHHLDVSGIIDRDRRNNTEIKKLEKDNIFTLDVAEVENLFCVPEIISLVSKHLMRVPEEDLKSIKKFVIDAINNEINNQISMHVANEIKFKLKNFNDKAKGVEGLKEALSNLSSSIKVENLYNDFSQQFNEIIINNDYLLALKLYNRKSLSSRVSEHLGLSNGGLAELVIRMANHGHSCDVKKALKPYFGAFSDKI